jgi:hypothetical protein
MNKGLPFALVVIAGAAMADAQIVITDYGATYTQNFDSLANTGTSSALPTGWFLFESGTAATTTYTAGTGSSQTGDTYSFGANLSTERAFGGLQSGSLVPTIGAQFQNGGAQTIFSITLSYRGEEWRLGATSRGSDRIDFQYSLDATALNTGTWIDFDSLDFSTPNTATLGAQDGNAAGNFTTFGPTPITGLNVAPGASVWIRWTDFNISGSDDGLGVDDFGATYSVVPEPAVATALLGGTALLIGIVRRRR